MNLAEIDDEHCFEEANAVAAVGVLTMKYAFDAKGFEKLELYLQKPLRLSNKIKQA